MRKCLGWLLVACLLIGMVPAVTFAEENDGVVYPVKGGNIYFNKSTGTITKCDWEVTEAIIPAEIEGIPVTTIDDLAFSLCSSLKSVEIPEGVTVIGNAAFWSCSNLISVKIPKSVTTIGKGAFSECRGLSKIEISEGVISIGESAFSECSNLRSIEIPEGIITIESDTFNECSNLSIVTIPKSVTSIGMNAFSFSSLHDIYYAGSKEEWVSIHIDSWNDDLREASVHYNSTGFLITHPVEEGNIYFDKTTGAIKGCDLNVSKIVIPNKIEGIFVTAIGENAFSECSRLRSIEISEGINSIEKGAFSGCSSLRNIEIPEGVMTIDDFTFDRCSSLNNIVIPESVNTIGEWAFEGCNNLSSIEIPEGVTAIGEGAFWNCRNLKSIEIPQGVTTIESFTFRDCSSLSRVMIPEGVTSIGTSAFLFCSNLSSIEIPEKVTSIESYTFYACSSLSNIEIPESVTTIGNSAFSGCEKLKDVFYFGSEEQWSSIRIDSGNEELYDAIVHCNRTDFNEGECIIESLNILNNNGQPLDNIPENEFYVNVDILNLNEKRDAVVVLATYDQNGKMLNICSATADSTAESRSSNIRVENPGGSVEAIKAMLILSLETPIPLCSSMSVSNSSATS